MSNDDWTALRFIAGVSVRTIDENFVRATVSVLDVQTMKVVDSAMGTAQTPFRYISGLRSFHSGPAILDAFEQVQTPDMILWNGHGVAHPRRCGLASHMGILLNAPSIGISDELLYGKCDLDGLPKERGAYTSIFDPKDGTEIGAAVRTRSSTRPVYVSIGHRVALKSAIDIVLQCAAHYRFPEPLRQARILSKSK